MDIVVPTILTASREDLEAKLLRLTGLVSAVQIDVVDGRFAKPATWPYAQRIDEEHLTKETGWLHDFGAFQYEIDLMVEHPEETVGLWIAAGASRIVVHIESVQNLPHLIDELKRKYGYEKGFAPDLLSFGLALNIDTDTSTIEPYLALVDYVQFMGIQTIGKQGQPFDARVLRKIETFHKTHPEILTQIDGGASLKTAPALLDAGIDRLIVGSDLWEETDLASELDRFAAIAEEHGRYS